MESCQYKIGKMIFTVQYSNEKELWKKLSKLQETFGEQICGVCGGETAFGLRTVDDNNYYEVQCRNPECGCKLSFGQTKKGDMLFPKRKDKQGNQVGENGWHKYIKDEPN